MRLSASAVLASFLAANLSPALVQTPTKSRQPVLGRRSATLLKVDGLEFKDLNHNGKLDLYEDWRKPASARAADLVRQMSVEDLAGVMLHGTLPAIGGAEASIGRGSGYDLARSKEMIDGKRINTFITRLGGDPTLIASSNNALQEIAEATRFGIPLTISTDPRNNFLYTAGASNDAGSFSKWPETTGMAAINDPALTRRYADTVRREYMAVGIREALSPQADLATEPRWARLNGTFGEDADVARAQVKAYVEGMQNGTAGLNSGSVITVVKHWVGYGAQKDGWDSHNYYGRYSSLTNSQLPYHVKPFLGAFEANVAAVMPTYSILENITLGGKPIEQVGAGMNSQLLTGMLRGKYGFQGVVISDWGITSDCSQQCREGMPAGQRATPAQIAMSWGVMDLPRPARFAKTVNAGVDQIGGTEDVAALLAAAKSGELKEPRMREAATRILQQKFETGAFEDPYVDADAAKKIVGNPASLQASADAQKRAMVPLENRSHAVPVKAGAKVWLFHVDPAAARAAGLTVVETPEAADVVIIRAETPSEMLHPGYFFGGRQHEGRLNFRPGDAAYDALLKAGKKPVVMTVYMDRPAILTEVKDKVAALYADFGVSDAALLDVVTGKAKAQGHLPFELPSSMAAVAAQSPGAPHDSARPLYPYGYALK
ncbi:glycoside hydrolase family 3 protein [Terriglobus roseus]|uniref:beta-glucosidase n=1 Tax=Terriglobus roseus TaxID=392734 RepID=A0A1H4L703_9BACT|nr:glycoside hydrolase family 3 N-terminal domain-containing protein [Terriglobus roseus]SEB66501.1 beta-glucosidase [Terriglobus roseus]